MVASRPPARLTKRLRITRSRTLSSAPPMMITVPSVMVAAEYVMRPLRRAGQGPAIHRAGDASEVAGVRVKRRERGRAPVRVRRRDSAAQALPAKRLTRRTDRAEVARML